MPAPPTEIHIKRKATDDPVDFLHVHSEVNSLRQNRQYVFKRQRRAAILNISNSQSFNNPQSTISFTGTQKSSELLEVPFQGKEVERDTLVQRSNQDLEQDRGNGPLPSFVKLTASTPTTPVNTSPSPSTLLTCAPEGPRRFHLSRTTTLLLPQSTTARIRGTKAPIAVFIERRKFPKLQAKVPNAAVSNDLKELDSPVKATQPLAAPSSSNFPQQNSLAPLRNTKLPSGKILPWDASLDRLAAEMESYTLGEIGRNIAESTPVEPVTSDHKSSSRFMPRAPRRRLNVPPAVGQASQSMRENGDDALMTDTPKIQGDESNYIIDTFVRMPAEMFESPERAENIGLLVLETQPDIDEFYNDYSDNEGGDYNDDEEDENAENHPSNDYPEEELDSDDEYGRNPYKYYRDPDDECDDFDVSYSGDDEGCFTNPLPWRPWMDRNAYRSDADDDDDEEKENEDCEIDD